MSEGARSRERSESRRIEQKEVPSRLTGLDAKGIIRRLMLFRCFRRCCPLVLVLLVTSCSGKEPARSSTDGATEPHGIRADVVLTPDADGATLTFLTPALSTFSMPASEVVGKPYYAATFAGGFDQGVDLDLHHEWGTVPADLHIKYVSPPMFPSGPYDIAVIVYTKTAITDAIRNDYYTVVPTTGELSAFTLSHDRILPGDPTFGNGVVRVNVQGADGTLELENRHDATNVGASLTDTVLTVP